MLEMELKMQVDDLAPIRSRLDALGAMFSRRTAERDIYFNAPDRDLGARDEALRIRYSDAEAVITYKGPKRKDLAFKAREEMATTVGEGRVLEEILIRLGFFRVAAVEKVRENYQYRGATISLDEVGGLGPFIEIEVMAEGDYSQAQTRIDEIQNELGLEGGIPLLTSYLEITLAKQ
jgi:adenylate cyclase class 2